MLEGRTLLVENTWSILAAYKSLSGKTFFDEFEAVCDHKHDFETANGIENTPSRMTRYSRIIQASTAEGPYSAETFDGGKISLPAVFGQSGEGRKGYIASPITIENTSLCPIYKGEAWAGWSYSISPVGDGFPNAEGLQMLHMSDDPDGERKTFSAIFYTRNHPGEGSQRVRS